MVSEDYYRLLGVSPEATEGEIESAYIRMKETLEKEGMFLMSREEVEKLRRKIDEAYLILSDRKSRFFYDSYLISVKSKFVKKEKVEIDEKYGFETEKVSGEFFRKVREARGMSIQEVAMVACITQRVIKAIEDEDISSLPPLTYLKGILKEYVRALKLPSSMVEEYLRILKGDK